MKKDFYVIVGLGKTGLSCARYCLENHIPFAVTDSNPEPEQLQALKKIAPDVATAFGGLSEKMLNKATKLLVSPGVPLKQPLIIKAMNKSIPIISDIELFVRKVKKPIIAVTGSNGKSTVVTLVGEMAKNADKNIPVAGNIGFPVLDAFNENADADGYIIELSSFQLERTSSINSCVASVLNICEDHMDYYDDLEEYITVKNKIYKNCQTAVVNRHDDRLYPSDKLTSCVSFGLDEPELGNFGIVKKHGIFYLAYGNHCLISTNDLILKGKHHLLNSLAALALGHCYGLDMSAMLKTLTTFSGLKHRCQFVRELGGVNWYNDSKATNVGATAAALESLDSVCVEGKIVLIAGGVSKGADFSPLLPLIKRFVRKMIIIGESAYQLERIFQGDVIIEYADDLALAVEKADLAAIRGDIVLLSPACSSFDMFDNFEHRGNIFINLVQSL